MSRTRRWLVPLGLSLAALFGLAACATPVAAPAPATIAPPGSAATQPDVPAMTRRLEIFSWWTTGGEAAGLLRLYGLYQQAHPQINIVNATVAGGEGSNAKAVLKSRMLAGDPPDSFQVHMGRELIDTWVTTGYMESLDELYRSEGWDKLFPKGALEILSSNGHYWSVPANIHRANVLWYNKKVFADNNLQPPNTFDEFFKVGDVLRSQGITPLALGDNGIWASTEIWETVLIGSLGADNYRGLWTGKTNWAGPEVKQALETFKRMLSYVNPDHGSLTWDQANDLVLNGKAAMTIMGDWIDADNAAKKKADVEGWAPAPGSSGVYDAMSDTFGLPRNVRDRQNATDWLKLIGSKQGQEAFNPSLGSICARTDCDPSLFDAYLQSAMKEWPNANIVPSLAHGAATSEDWLMEINTYMNHFVMKQDVAAAQNGFLQACQDANVCK